MSHIKFDSKIKSLLLEHYQSTIDEFSERNTLLSTNLTDLKTSLLLNQSFFKQYLTKTYSNSGELLRILAQFKHLLEENCLLMSHKNDIELQSHQLQEIVEDTPTRIREEINQIQSTKAQIHKIILEKERIVKKLQIDLLKGRKNCIVPHPKIEVIVTNPTKSNLIINHEIESARILYKKIVQMTANEKNTANKIASDVKHLKDEMINLKDKIKEIPKQNSFDLPNLSNEKKRRTKTISMIMLNSPFKTSSPSKEQSKLYTDTSHNHTKTNIEDNKMFDYTLGNEKKNDDEDFQIKQRLTLSYKNKKKQLRNLQIDYDTLKNTIIKDEKSISKYKLMYKDMKEKIDNILLLIKDQNAKNKKNGRKNNINNRHKED